MPELENVREVPVETPFGKPSDAFIVGELDGVTVAFLPRHARGHKFTPTKRRSYLNIRWRCSYHTVFEAATQIIGRGL
jgi:5'-methylthioadenosine phosphorylase